MRGVLYIPYGLSSPLILQLTKEMEIIFFLRITRVEIGKLGEKNSEQVQKKYVNSLAKKGLWVWVILVIMPCFWNAIGIRHIFFQCRRHTAYRRHSRKHWDSTIKCQVFRITTTDYYQKILKEKNDKLILSLGI